ncbi:MAG: hypothetical protein KJ626_05225 [Verrucomicrobia bacterium]|nr:hypothetical protein [Verrucomicrobiota bacterium]
MPRDVTHCQVALFARESTVDYIESPGLEIKRMRPVVANLYEVRGGNADGAYDVSRYSHPARVVSPLQHLPHLFGADFIAIDVAGKERTQRT